MDDPNHKLSTLIDNWECDVEVFKEWVFCLGGINKKSRIYKEMSAKVKTIEDIDEWILYFDGDVNNIENTTRSYLLHSLNHAV